MIDTIKLLIPLESALVEKLKSNLTRFRKEDLKSGKIEFEFFTANIELGSYHRTIAIKSTDNPQGLFVEFSVPKYEKGNNVEMIYPNNLINIMEKLYVEICEYMDYELPHFSMWPVYRLDICYNWILKDIDQAKQALSFIKRLDFPRKTRFEYETSIMYKGSSYTIKFYLKGPEFKKHDSKKLPIEQSVELQNWADKILRFEVNLKRTYLEGLLGYDKVLVEHIANNETILENLSHYLKQVFFYVNTKTMEDSEIEAILFSKFSKQKATRLFSFHKEYYANGPIKQMYARGGLNRTTIYRYKKDLKLAGIGFSSELPLEKSSILEQLIIPSPNSKFELLDFKSNISNI
ncbi:MAG: Phage replication protein [Candidatus Taylorbacteria bacterium]|nr:Phage replication protein [Candidatus Taylorbacteria bacterium]